MYYMDDDLGTKIKKEKGKASKGPRVGGGIVMTWRFHVDSFFHLCLLHM